MHRHSSHYWFDWCDIGMSCIYWCDSCGNDAKKGFFYTMRTPRARRLKRRIHVQIDAFHGIDFPWPTRSSHDVVACPNAQNTQTPGTCNLLVLLGTQCTSSTYYTIYPSTTCTTYYTIYPSTTCVLHIVHVPWYSTLLSNPNTRYMQPTSTTRYSVH